MDKVETSVLIGIVGLLTIIGGIDIMNDDDLYYCESRQIVMQCDRLSSTAKTCYDSNGDGKRCLDVWKEVVNDIENPIGTQSEALQYICNNEECVEV